MVEVCSESRSVREERSVCANCGSVGRASRRSVLLDAVVMSEGHFVVFRDIEACVTAPVYRVQ